MTDIRKTLVFVNTLIDTVGWSLLIPALPGLYNKFHMTNVSVGAISSFLSLLVFICGTLQGKASDYFGRIKMLQLSATAQLIGHVLIVVAVKSNSLHLFVLARCFPALLKCGMVVSQAFLYDISTAEDISRDIGTLMASSNVAFIIGPIVGGYAYSIDSYFPFYLGIALAMTSLFILMELDILMAHSNSVHRVPTAATANDAVGNRVRTNTDTDAYSLLHYLHMKFAFQVGNSLYESLFAQHVQRQLNMSGSQIGLMLGFTGALSALTNGFVLKWILRALDFPEHILWLFVFALCSGLIGWALSTTLPCLITSVVVITVSSNLFLSIIQSIIAQSQKYAELKKKAQATRIYASWREDKVFELGNSPVVNIAEMPRTERKSKTSKLPESTELTDDVTAVEDTDGTDCESDEVPDEDAASGRDTITSYIDDHTRGIASPAKSKSRSVGVVFGMSSAADRAARILSPLLGGVLLEQYGNMGLVYLSTGASLYCLLLVLTCMPDRRTQQALLLGNDERSSQLMKKQQ